MYEEKIKKLCDRFNNFMKNKDITKDDLLNLFNMDFNEFTVKFRRVDSMKKKMLFQIYLYPFIIYNSKYLSSDIMDDFVGFTKERYMFERYEYDTKYINKEITKEEYNDELNKLNDGFIYSSTVGINIFRTIDKEYVKILKK